MIGYLARQSLRREDARERAEAEDPAVQRAIETDVQGDDETAALAVAQLL